MASVVEIIIKTIDQSGGNVDKLSSNLGKLAAQYLSVTAVAATAARVLSDSVKSTVQYADQVRKLSTLSGQTTEETSRFIQVLDDYKISADDAMVATRALTKEGYAPSIETLAQLSDQYLSLSSAQEKNEFVLKNLGRGGLQWVEVLNKGSDAIRKQGESINQSLILSQKQVDAARRLEISQDELNDSWMAMKITIGSAAIPALTGVIDEFNATTRAIQIMKEQGLNPLTQMLVNGDGYINALKQANEEQEASKQAMLNSATAADGLSESTTNLADAQKNAEEAAKRLSDIYTGLLSSMFAIQDQNDNYDKTVADLTQRDAELAAQKNQLTLQMWEEQRAGKLTNDEYLKYVQNLDEITKAQTENAQAREAAAKDNEKASTQRVYDLVQEKLAADGIINTGEYEYLQNLAVQKGLVSRAAADQAIKENQLADSLVSNFAKTQPAMEQTLTTMQAIAAYNGTVVNFGVNFTQTGSAGGGYAGGGGGGYASVTSYNSNDFGVMHSRDAGGSGVAGTPYLIGQGAQPEVFVPSSNGTFYPKGKGMGSTYNITINNPKKETAENSIRESLKKLSFIGVAQ